MKNYKKSISAHMIQSLFCLTSVALISGCDNNTQEIPVSDKLVESAKSVSSPTHNIDIWPTLDISVKKNDEIENKVQALLAGMTLEQKVAPITLLWP